MKIDPSKIYYMPLIMGQVAPEQKNRVGFAYREIQYVGLQYQTDADAVRALLPDCYQPADEPTVTVMFAYNDGVEFMADRGYRIASVNVAARFDGEKDHVEGNYVLVMFENDTVPIILGREGSGIHKMYADISHLRILPNGHLRCEASLWGHMLFGIDLGPLKEQNVVVRSVATKRMNQRPLLGYKYIPCLDGPPDVSYPTVLPSEVKADKLWLGKQGGISFGDPDEGDIGSLARVLDALKTLPVREITQTLHLRGSSILRSDLGRRLR
jgi:acetoacetate decarboxylase